MDRCLPWVLMLPEFRSGGHADHRLPQNPFMAAHYGVGGRATTVSGSKFELLRGQSVQRNPLHGVEYAPRPLAGGLSHGG